MKETRHCVRDENQNEEAAERTSSYTAGGQTEK